MQLNLKQVVKTASAAVLAASLGLGGAWSLVDKWEGSSTTMYRDSLGIPTICRGATNTPLLKLVSVTQDECDDQTLKDLIIARNTVNSCIKVPLTQGETAAWVSFALNVGPGKRGPKGKDGMCMLKSGALPSHVKLLAQGKNKEACAMLMQWTKAGGKTLRGLYNRRLDETAICMRDLQ